MSVATDLIGLPLRLKGAGRRERLARARELAEQLFAVIG
jgi:hypothetical protein